MRFILCARERRTGSVTPLSSGAYLTRKEAVDAGALSVNADILSDCELFLVDLDAATPVMVVAGEPAERAFVRPPLPNPFAAPAPVTPSSAWTEVPPLVASGPAPAAVPAPAPTPDETEVVIEEWPFVPGGEAGGVGPSTLLSDLMSDDEDRAGVWWLETGGEADASETGHAASAEVEAVRELVEAALGTTDERRAEESPEPRFEEPRFETSADDAEVSPPADAPIADTGPDAEPFVTFTYRGGPVDLTSWSCADCVYVVTCPRSASETPASCGSFQWRPV